MQGVQYIINDQGEKTAVVIDLKQWGNLWDEIASTLISQITINEDWFHQSPFKENLDQSLEWNAQNPLQNSDLAVLEGIYLGLFSLYSDHDPT
jgi:hypothetical protein